MCGSGETVTTGQHMDRRFNQPAGTNKQYDGSHGFKKNDNGKISMVPIKKSASGPAPKNITTGLSSRKKPYQNKKNIGLGDTSSANVGKGVTLGGIG